MSKAQVTKNQATLAKHNVTLGNFRFKSAAAIRKELRLDNPKMKRQELKAETNRILAEQREVKQAVLKELSKLPMNSGRTLGLTSAAVYVDISSLNKDAIAKRNADRKSKNGN